MTTPNLNPTQQDALAYMQQQLAAWGVSSLYGDVLNMVQAGYDQDTITLRLQQTDAYKQRFAGNIARQKAGLPVLSPADYIATENQYRSVMKNAGLPAGFYDSTDDFTNFISNDVSPAEMQDRVNVAANQWLNADPATKQMWTDYYGLSQGDAIASILDPEKSQALIDRRSTAVQIGAAADRNGLAAPTVSRAEFLANSGLTADQAKQGYSTIGQILAPMQNIASRFGTTFDQTQAENATLLNEAGALNRQRTLSNDEQTFFRSGAALSDRSLSQNNNY